ncbi:MAG: hypothetical protein HN341_13045 [Verrucomicrobia bacterium]|nr:hypothetical protein [Verrucomicrobiota bacterium]
MLVDLRIRLRSMVGNMLGVIHDPWPSPVPCDPGREAEVSPVAFDVADAGGLE